jgi:glycosyltransferase involved in cell wall biosynthesis
VNPLRILELRSVVGSGGGPEKTILLGTAGADRREFAITVCYLRDLRDRQHDLEERARALGVDYQEVTERNSFDWRVWPALKDLCRRRGIQLVHSHDYKTDLLAYMLSRALGTLSLATAHGWVGHTPRERMVYYPADKWLLARFARVIAVSGEIRNELIQTGSDGSRVTVVLNGIDPGRFARNDRLGPDVRMELGLPADAFVVGAIGRLEPQKRFDLLIDAAASLRASYPSLRLIVAGHGSLLVDLQARIDALQLGGVCRLLGHYRDVPRLHHAFDLLVQASDYEGTPNSVLEAMAMRTPVVATDAGGTAELIEAGVHGIVVPCGSAAILARAIADLIDDPARREQFRAAARARVEGPLSFASRMRAVEQIYRELAQSPRSPVRA